MVTGISETKLTPNPMPTSIVRGKIIIAHHCVPGPRAPLIPICLITTCPIGNPIGGLEVTAR